MQKARISKRLVDSLQATGKLYEQRDSEVIGFSVRVTPAGYGRGFVLMPE